MLSKIRIPGLFVTGTDTGIGKTMIAGAIADWFRRRGARVAVCKPVATGCEHRREGLVSQDAEFLAHCADTRHPLHLVCPQCYAEPLAPAVAADRARRPVDWQEVERALAAMTSDADVMIVEGVGGVMVPMDERHTLLDVAAWLGLPAVVVARAGLGTVNHTLLTLQALRQAKVSIAGVVVNRYPPGTPEPAEETNPRVIERWGRVSVLALVPDCEIERGIILPEDVVAAIDPVDWGGRAGMG